MFKAIIISTLLLSSGLVYAQKRMALLVGISSYEDSHWPKLNGTKDVTYMDSTLKNYGFTNLSRLTNAQATQQAIISALQRLASIAQTGDIVLFHFSGHGQLIADQNHDEVDGYDEAIVPWDSPLGTMHSNDPRRLIRDDVLASLFLDIRRKIGTQGTLICILDACYAAGLMRKENHVVVRGATFPVATEAYQKEMPLLSHPIDTVTIEYTSDKSLGAYVAFFACLANEKNFEYQEKRMGSLTYAFCTALNASVNADTYEILYGKIRREMNHIVAGQTPMLEGSRNQVVFSTNRHYVFHYSINNVTSKEAVIINGGLNFGLGIGDIIEFRKPGIGAQANVSTGTITKISANEAEVKLAKPVVNVESVEDLWGYLVFSAPTSAQLGIKCIPGEDAELLGLYKRLKINPEVQLNFTDPDLVLGIFPEKPDTIELRSSLGKSLFLLPRRSLHADQLYDTIYKTILAYKLGKFYKGLRASSINTNGTMEFVDLHVGDSPQPLQSRRDQTKGWSFHSNDIVTCRLRNTGNTTAYFYLLNILDNGLAKLMFPWFDDDYSQYRLSPGYSCDPNFKVAQEPGKEMLILIVSLHQLTNLETFYNNIRHRGQNAPAFISDYSVQALDFTITK